MAVEEFTLHGPEELLTFAPLPDPPAGAAAAAESDQGESDLSESESESETDESEGESDDQADSADESEGEAGQMYPLGLTENKALTYITTTSPCLDFFFQVVPHASRRQIHTLLSLAWNEDALLALKLVFHLRGIRGTGKSDRENFYVAACWLFANQPATFNANVAKVPQFGYYKDLLELLQRLIETPRETEARLLYKEEHLAKRAAGKHKAKIRAASKAAAADPDPVNEVNEVNADDDSDDSDVDSVPARHRRKKSGAAGYFRRKGAAARAAIKEGTLRPREERVAEDIEKGKALKAAAAVVRKDKQLKLAARAVEKYKSDPEFATLYTSVARVFSEALAKDLTALNEHGAKARISLAAKWCPSLNSAYDRQTLLCEGIACHFFPRAVFDGQLTQYQYVYMAREKLRKEVLVPLRKALELPEVYMSAKEWSRIPYTRVASVAMKRYKEIFLEHDEERFKSYLDKVEKGEKKIAAGALLPHEILKEAIKDGDGARVAELQWRSMVEEMKKGGNLADSISICDVSGSMSGQPMEVCIALGLLTSELSEEPWKGKLITFSSDPVFHTIEGSTLAEKHRFVENMPWDMNTDFQKVFDLLLSMAKEKQLPGERMVKRLFVYSDMEFDEANGRSTYDYRTGRRTTVWETDYAQVCRKYEEAGYGAPPEIVFWNLRSTSSTPVMKGQKGVALVSGYAKNLLKLFIDRNGDVGEYDPMSILHEAVSGPLYEDLVVVK